MPWRHSGRHRFRFHIRCNTTAWPGWYDSKQPSISLLSWRYFHWVTGVLLRSRFIVHRVSNPRTSFIMLNESGDVAVSKVATVGRCVVRACAVNSWLFVCGRCALLIGGNRIIPSVNNKEDQLITTADAETVYGRGPRAGNSRKCIDCPSADLTQS